MSGFKSRRAVIFLLFAAILAITAGCGNKPSNVTGSGSSGGSADSDVKHPVVTIEMDSGKTIRLELYPEVAPNTVNNFISLVNKGFYNGTVFHRVIPGFMIQGGDPEGTGAGGPGYSIAGEFSGNGFKNDLKHTRGVLSMARSQHPNSAGSQFFIMVADAPHLDGQYAAFGKVTEGMEVVDEIVNLPRDSQDKPEQLPVMKSVTVDTLGMMFKEPEKAN
ncbi:peptidylprolyl isomerase [Paenibacillus beijingensis]|uniref:Peptidyl-prolyl cis-trans isomerase n=1 Tax=Paenibacillus beijingensis TaxID=1126833 RepID=A0A0D5NN11_9BACL|nr:peptidylprolyl isomerase [Paenibacillus beijingensis]AJY76684.1 peptidylprolyl isomerase [Paenibacillus beijingensis]